MKHCPNCGTKFTYGERLKSLNRKYSEIHCSKCKEKYRKNNRITNGLSVFFACIISLITIDKLSLAINSYTIRLVVAATIGAIVCFIILCLFNLVIKYERFK